MFRTQTRDRDMLIHVMEAALNQTTFLSQVQIVSETSDCQAYDTTQYNAEVESIINKGCKVATKQDAIRGTPRSIDVAFTTS